MGKFWKDQNNNDCGVFSSAIAAAMVPDALVPQNVDGYRRHMISLVEQTGRGGLLDCKSTKDIFTLSRMVQGTQGDPGAEGECMEEDNKKDED